MDSPFQPLVGQWIEKIRLAEQEKDKQFGKDAAECMRFYNGPYEFMYGLKYQEGSSSFIYTGDHKDLPKPSFCMTVNKVAEAVQIFGPVLYHRNPVRQTNPRKMPMLPIELFGDPMDPMVQQAYLPLLQQVEQNRGIDKSRAILIDSYLNYTPTALDLKTNCRDAVDEAIIKGMGVLWHEVYRPKGGGFKMVGSFYDSVDYLVMDPDAEKMEDCKWIARKCVHPKWQVEQDYELPPGTLRGNAESFGQMGTVAAQGVSGDYDRRRGLTNDLVTYWKIWTKMGIGARMSGITEDVASLDMFGDFCHLVICEDCQYPLNLPPRTAAGVDVWADPMQVQSRLQWETPFWADDAWPFSFLAFHRVPRQIWPMSHFKPGMGELKFINWVYSFLAGKIRTACRDIIAVAKSASEEIKRAIISGTDYELLEIEKAHGTISEVVQFLRHPEFHGDIWKVLQAVENNFEKRIGLTELSYGFSKSQFRSAAEAEVKADALQVRPDDMANKVEDWMTDVARREALAARWHLEPEDVQPVLGDLGAQWWTQLVTPTDPMQLLHQLEYRIEAGSAKKPNKERDVANMQNAMQSLFPFFQQYAMASGDFSQVNALITDWAKSIDLDPKKYLLSPPPPMPPPGPPMPGQPAAQPPR